MAENTDDLYSDGGEVAVEETEEVTEETSESSGEPALLPRSFFQGKDLEVGKTCEVRIEKLTQDSALVSYVPHKEEADEEMTVETDTELEGLMA